VLWMLLLMPLVLLLHEVIEQWRDRRKAIADLARLRQRGRI
jgi:hypothetical protein